MYAKIMRDAKKYGLFNNIRFPQLRFQSKKKKKKKKKQEKNLHMEVTVLYDGPNGSLFISILLHNSEF